MHRLNKEIGSNFYLLESKDPEYKLLEQNKISLDVNDYSFYYSGRNALLAIIEKIKATNTIETIWLPYYYCYTISDLINHHFSNIKYYKVSPFEFTKTIDITSFSNKNDIVILNNFWGLSTFDYPQTDRAFTIEDHTHGWLSNQSLNSKADYCFASLRKVYPIPLGSVVWSPNTKKKLDYYQDTADEKIENAYQMIEDSMLLKRQFIKNQSLVKPEYLLSFIQGESLLSFSENYIKPKAETIDLIKSFFTLDPNPVKSQNLKCILQHIEPSKHFKIIQKEGVTPFGLLLLFRNYQVFDSFRIWLISNQIFPAHLWPNNKVLLKWKYLLNIHVDFRYDIDSMSYLVEKINVWVKNNV